MQDTSPQPESPLKMVVSDSVLAFATMLFAMLMAERIRMLSNYLEIEIPPVQDFFAKSVGEHWMGVIAGVAVYLAVYAVLLRIRNESGRKLALFRFVHRILCLYAAVMAFYLLLTAIPIVRPLNDLSQTQPADLGSGLLRHI